MVPVQYMFLNKKSCFFLESEGRTLSWRQKTASLLEERSKEYSVPTVPYGKRTSTLYSLCTILFYQGSLASFIYSLNPHKMETSAC